MLAFEVCSLDSCCKDMMSIFVEFLILFKKKYMEIKMTIVRPVWPVSLAGTSDCLERMKRIQRFVFYSFSCSYGWTQAPGV